MRILVKVMKRNLFINLQDENYENNNTKAIITCDYCDCPDYGL